MIINELICRSDGTQELVEREVPDDFFDVPEPQPTTETDLMNMAVDHEFRLTILELGV